MENIRFELPKNRSAAIKVIGIGGGGSNAVNYMFEQGITGVDFIVCNTDAQALNSSAVPVKIQLGVSITEGLGAGADPEIGEKAALESLEEIKSILDINTKMIFITAGMGGGTGTGAAPIIADISKEMGILTVGIVTIPFYFEGRMRLEQAQKGVKALRQNVDSLIVINNDKLRELYGNLGFKAGFAKADEVLTTAAKGIAEVITHHYKQNIDLRDARTVLKNSGTAVMGSSTSDGENRAKEAAVRALDSPLLNDNKITGAKNVLLLIVSGKIEITIDEIGIISDYIQTEAGNNANIIMGIGEDENLEEHISVTIVATGFPTEVQRSISHEEKKIFHSLDEVIDSKSNILKENFSIPDPKSDRYKPTMSQLFLEKQNKKKTEILEYQRKNNHINHFEPNSIETLDKLQQRYIFKNLFEKDEYFPFGNSKKDEYPISQNEKKYEIFFELENNNINEESDFYKKGKNNENIQNNNIKKYKKKINLSPINSPIPENLEKKNQERNSYIKIYNHKLKEPIKDIEESERIPAYKRQGIDLDKEDARSKTISSRYSIEVDEYNDESKNRTNN